MHQAFTQGLLISFGLLCVMGPQNLFVLGCGINRNGILAAIFISTFCDSALIALGVFGVSKVLAQTPILLNAVSIVGVVFLAIYGVNLILNRKENTTTSSSSENDKKSQTTIALLALGFSLLNPGVYLDTLAILGSFAQRYNSPSREAFVIGACLASLLWFAALGFGGSILQRSSALKRFGQVGQRIMGFYILACAILLLYTFIS